MSADQTEARLREALLAIRELRARVEADERARSEPIAVVGLGCRLPGGVSSPDAYWQLLLDGVDAVTEVPPERWDADALFDPDVLAPGATTTRWGGFLEHVDRFDPDFFGISPREAARMDPQQRLLLEVAYEALEDAGETLERLDGSATGVFVGMHNYADDYTRIQLADPDGIDTYTGTGTAQSIAANRLSYVFGFRGPSLALDTACSSSLVAVHLAVHSLRRGECELALAGGVNLMLSPESTIALSRMQLMAADGRCKTFDAGADGFVRGEGCGLVALKRLSDAVEAGDPIRAVIRGSAVNQDGHTNGLTAPSGLAQRDVVRAALSDGAVGPGEIGFVETHGTGTVLGDPIEVEALVDVLGAQRAPGSTCVLGAVKTNLGHLEAAAGVAGLIKAVLAVERGTIPPNLHFSALNPHISFGGAPFVIPTRPMEWPPAPDRRVAGVSSFGWGGTNAHVVLAGPPEPAPGAERGPAGAPLLVPLSARDPDALRERAAGLRDLASTDQAGLASVAYTAAVRRTHHDHRLAVVASSHADLARELDAFLAREPSPGLATGLVPEQRGGLAFVYAGQGPQSPGMGAQLLEHEPVFNEIVEGCDALVRDLAGWSIVDELRAEASASRLDRTDVNQPVTFALQAGLTALLASWGVVPDVVVGHSAGEVAAAHAAGVLTLEDAVRVAFHRGRLQQQACGTGKMAAVALPSAEVERIVERIGGRLVVAAVNSPGSTTLAGPPDAVEAAVEVLRAEDVFARVLHVDFASHSPAMDELTGELISALSGLEPRPAHLPVVSTVTGRPAEPGDFGPAYWGRNIREPVRFAQAVDGLARAGNQTFLELGPHPVLGAAVSECLAAAGVEGAVLASLRRGQDERSTLLAALANLYVDGQAIDWSAVTPRGDVIRLPAYPWQRRRYWVDGPRRRPSRRGSASGHPLLGGRIRTPLVQEAVVACDLGGAGLLERHEAGGLSLLPMSAIVELALAASGEILAETACGLAGVVVHEPIPLGGAVPECQLVLAPESEGASFRLYGLVSGAEAWTLHAEGKLLTRAAGTPHRNEDASTRRLTVELPAEADARFVVPPALVDAALSALDDVLPAVAADRARLAVSFDRLDLVARVDGPFTVTVTPRVSTPDGSAVADVAVEDAAGRPVLRIDGVVLRAVPVEHLRRTEPWQDWLYEVAWRPQVGSPSSGDRFVLVGGGESAGKVAELAEARGAVCARVEDAHSLAEALAASGPGRRRVVWLGGLDSLLDERMSVTEVEATSSVPGGALLAVARVLVNAAKRETRLWVVTRGGVEAGDVVPDPIQAALWGLGLGIGLEHPEIWGGLVDIDPSVSEFEALLAELGGEHEDQVAVRSAGRFVPRLVRAAPPVAPEVTWRADAAYLVTGGLGAVGLRVARLAAENGARFLVLTSRRGLPEGVERSSLAPGSVDARRAAAVEEIEQLGAAVRVVACDAADPEQLGRLLDELDAGDRPVAGILHAAAAIDPRPLLDLDARSLAEELRAKVGGGWAIDLATRRRALDFVCLFGSTTGLWGSAGLGAYTAANRFLDALARRRRSLGLPALAVDWGLWDEADRLSAEQRAVARAAGLRPMASGEAFAALCRLLGSGTTQIAVADLDWQTLAAVYEARGARPLFAEVREQAARPATGQVRGEFLARLEQAAAHDRQGLLHGHVRAEVARVLGVDPPEALDPTRGFFAMGMDSLTSIELRNRLEIALDRPLAPSLAFNYPTVDALAAHLGSEALGLPDDSAGVEVNGGADWETLSDDELVALLARRLEEIG